MRELDEAMRAYLDTVYTDAPKEDKELFLELLNLQDPELFRLISGKDKDARYDPIIDSIKARLKEINS